jgi:hypothetical protein
VYAMRPQQRIHSKSILDSNVSPKDFKCVFQWTEAQNCNKLYTYLQSHTYPRYSNFKKTKCWKTSKVLKNYLKAWFENILVYKKIMQHFYWINQILIIKMIRKLLLRADIQRIIGL